MQENSKFFALAIASLLGLGGVTFKLVIERMDKQEARAALDIAALRKEIETTKADAKDAVSAAAAASKDAVAATAIALKDSVTATVSASKDALASTALASSDKIEALSRRIEKLEDRALVGGQK